MDPLTASLIAGGLSTGAGLFGSYQQKKEQERMIEEQKKEQAMTNLINVLAGGSAQAANVRAAPTPSMAAVGLQGIADTMGMAIQAKAGEQRNKRDELLMLDQLATNQSRRDAYRGRDGGSGAGGAIYWGDAYGISDAAKRQAEASGKAVRPASEKPSPYEEELLRLLQGYR